MRTYNLREVKPLRNLDPQHIDQMVALRGMVIRTSQIIPDLKQAFFRCIVCNASKEARCSTDKELCGVLLCAAGRCACFRRDGSAVAVVASSSVHTALCCPSGTTTSTSLFFFGTIGAVRQFHRN